MSKNERKTEAIIQKKLEQLGYFDAEATIRVELQKSEVAGIKNLLKTASKSEKGKNGSPEFIITSEKDPDFVFLIECKASTKDHISSFLKKNINQELIDNQEDTAYFKRVQKYACDGVLHYSKFLSKSYNVISIAASGETMKELETTIFYQPKGSDTSTLLKTKESKGKIIDSIISWDDFIENASFDPKTQRLRFDELMNFARDLHDFMRDHAKLTESEKPLLVSGTLIALKNKAFSKSYSDYNPEDLQKQWMEVISKEIEKSEIPKAKKANMVQPYSSIAVHPELGKPTTHYPKGVLHELISMLNQKVWPFISVYHDFDIVGQFYGEFLKYTGGDKKALGIVLTPRHVTELFSLLLNINKKSKVLDICAGTGGFLISAMSHMMRDASTEKEREEIKRNGLVGVEQQPNMFALAASNMILRGDGKANLYQGSCFDEAITKEIKERKCDIGMLNPPFAQKDSNFSELRFVIHLLDCLQKGGLAAVIVPISCAISPSEEKKELLKHHTLLAVMSMPGELFSPVGVVTCVMIFKAKVPHAQSNQKSWFGYWRNDGFIKTKHKGRIDLYHQWEDIRNRWVESYRNKEVHPGESVIQKVGAEDEWCAEAYMDTDYSTLTREHFEREIKKYVVFNILNTELASESNDEDVE